YGAGWKQAPIANSPSTASEKKQNDSVYLGRRILTPGSWRSYLCVFGENLASAGFSGAVLRSAQQAKYRWETHNLTTLVASRARGHATNVSNVLAAYEVCLNFSNVWSDGRPGSRLVPHLRLRDFEGPMSRTCYVTGHSDEITEFYRVGHEIET